MIKTNSYLLLSLFSLVLFLPGMASLPVVDRDEAHFSQASRQMVQTGNYFQIRFQEVTRFQKPPGINWLQAASVKLLSDKDSSAIWPYRLPSLLGALLSVLLTFFFARRFVSERVALIASAFLASSLLLCVETHMAVTDAALLSSVLMMQGALWIIYQAELDNRRAHWGWALLFWISMAYGFVLKGTTPLVGVLTVGALCLIDRRVAWLSGLRVYRGLLLFVLLSLAWLIPVNMAENSNYLLQMIHKDLLPKLKGGHESHGQPPFFHLLILPLTFWPASLFLWQGGAYSFKKRHQPIVRFLLAWILPTWIFFDLMPTKLPQYVLPTIPAIALLCALGIDDIVKAGKPSLWVRLLQILWCVLSLGLALAVSSLPYLLMREITAVSVVLLISMSLMSIICAYFAWKGAYQRAVVAVLLTALLSFPLIYEGLFPQLKPLWISRNIAQFIRQKELSDSRPLLVVGYSEPSLVFYLNTKQVLFTYPQQAVKLMQDDPNRLLLVNSDHDAQMEQDLGHLGVRAHLEGFNYSTGRWVDLSLSHVDNR